MIVPLDSVEIRLKTAHIKAENVSSHLTSTFNADDHPGRLAPPANDKWWLQVQIELTEQQYRALVAHYVE